MIALLQSKAGHPADEVWLTTPYSHRSDLHFSGHKHHLSVKIRKGQSLKQANLRHAAHSDHGKEKKKLRRVLYWAAQVSDSDHGT